MKLVEAKAGAGEIEGVDKEPAEPSLQRGGDVIDLTELLRRSLSLAALQAAANKTSAAPAKKAPAPKAAAKAATRKAVPAKTTARRAA
jgi:DNA end-binding protein Ku